MGISMAATTAEFSTREQGISGGAGPSGIPRAIIPASEDFGLGSGVGSDGGFDLTSAPLRPMEQRLAFGQGGFSTEPGLTRGATVAKLGREPGGAEW